MVNLNDRQLALYGLLKSNPTKAYKQEEIARKLSDFYPICETDNFHDSNARKLITADIRAINNSDSVSKIIISGVFGVKIANSEEFKKVMYYEKRALMRRLKRYHKKMKKAGLDGQIRINDDDIEIIETFS